MGGICLEQELGAALGSFQAGSCLPWDDGAEDFGNIWVQRLWKSPLQDMWSCLVLELPADPGFI